MSLSLHLNKEHNFGGEPLQGFVRFETDKEVRVRSVIASLSGTARAEWKLSNGTRYRGTVNLISVQFHLVDPRLHDGIIVLAPGTFEWPFSVEMPPDSSPPSYEAGARSRKQKSYVRYSLYVKMQTEALLSFNIVRTFPITMSGMFEIRLARQHAAPVTQYQATRFAVGTGKHVLEVAIPRGIALCNSTIDVRVRLNNCSSWPNKQVQLWLSEETGMSLGQERRKLIIRGARTCNPLIAGAHEVAELVVNIPIDAKFTADFDIQVLKVVHKLHIACDSVNTTIPLVLLPRTSTAVAVCASLNQPVPNFRLIKRPVWVKDDEHLTCQQCSVPFSFFLRRHHCRGCGKVFCDDCCPIGGYLDSSFGYGQDPVRVCLICRGQVIAPEQQSHAIAVPYSAVKQDQSLKDGSSTSVSSVHSDDQMDFSVIDQVVLTSDNDVDNSSNRQSNRVLIAEPLDRFSQVRPPDTEPPPYVQLSALVAAPSAAAYTESVRFEHNNSNYASAPPDDDDDELLLQSSDNSRKVDPQQAFLDDEEEEEEIRPEPLPPFAPQADDNDIDEEDEREKLLLALPDAPLDLLPLAIQSTPAPVALPSYYQAAALAE